MATAGANPNADRTGGERSDGDGMNSRPITVTPPAQPDPIGAVDRSPVPETAMPEETYDEWHAKLTDPQKRWVATAVDALHWCEDPEGLVRADMASSEYALVARREILGSRDEPFRKSSHGSLVELRLSAEHCGGERGAAALRAMDRMESAGISADDILVGKG